MSQIKPHEKLGYPPWIHLGLLMSLCLALPSSLRAAGRTPWHHEGSPYRAEFSVTKPGNHPRAGSLVAVPVCNLASMDGNDLIAYDARGNQLSLLSLGLGAKNRVLALIMVPDVKQRVFVYFGSKSRSPQHRQAFLPGLILDIRTKPDGPFDSWAQVETLLKGSQRIGQVSIDHIAQADNPVDNTDAIIMVINGFLRIASNQNDTLMLVSDDAGYLFVDDQLVISRDGRHWANDAVRGESRATLPLKAGAHRIRCVVLDAGGGQMALVARMHDERRKETLGYNDFVQSACTKLQGVEARRSTAPLPCFDYTIKSYMSFNGIQYTEVELFTFNDAQTTWYFQDGTCLDGPKVSRVFVGLGTHKIVTRQGQANATGSITFPERAPALNRMANNKAFQYYSKLMLQGNIDKVEPVTLRGYAAFLKYQQLNPDLVPVCQAILSRKDIDDQVRRQTLYDLARYAARDTPETAAKAYDTLYRALAKDPGWPELTTEYAEFMLFRCRDDKAAEKLLSVLRKKGDRTDVSLSLLYADLALLRADAELANDILDRLRARESTVANQRLTAVKSNAFRERFYDLLDAGFIQESRHILQQWQELAIEDRRNGHLPLARARLMRRMGWLEGALTVLESAVLLNPLLPNLPEVELLRAELFREAGQQDKARELFERIKKMYPNHPAAKTAEEML